MLRLTEEQITFIENDIKVRGITSPDLSIDLLDHICCLIEDELDEYRNFDTVYQKTLLLFGEKGLKEIQEETNRLLTFKHYYFMNATMKISGYVSSVMILLGSFFKFQHWPGANVLILTGIFFLTVVFLPILFILKFKQSEENNRSIVLSIVGFVSALLISSGILFRLLHWPGARMMTITGCALLLFAYLPIYILSVYKNTTNKINATATIILIIAGAGIFVLESGSGLPRTVSDSFWRGVVENNQLLQYQYQLNQHIYQIMQSRAENDSVQLKKLKQLEQSTRELLQYTKSMKTYLISISEGLTELQADTLHLDEIRVSGSSDLLTARLLNPEYAAFDYTAKKLKTRIERYKELVAQLASDVHLESLQTDSITVYGERVSWELSNFEKLPLPLVIYNIIRIELAIQAVETAAIDAIQLN